MPTEASKLEDQYQKKEQRQHILDAPDTYVGSIEIVIIILFFPIEIVNKDSPIERNE